MLKRTRQFRMASIIGICILASFAAGRVLQQNLTKPPQPGIAPLDKVTVPLKKRSAEIPEPAHAEAPIEVIQERYPSGKVKIRREVTRDAAGNYVLHGAWKMWNSKGDEIASGQYRNNKRHGIWKRLHSGIDSELFSTMPYSEFQATFHSQATFHEGRLDGKWIILDRNRRKISEWEYSDGVRHGVSTWRFASGRLMREVVYREGLMDGSDRSWDEQSRLVAAETYQDGRKVARQVEFYDSGQKKSERMYLHAQYVIDTADDWWNAQPATYRRVGRDELLGRSTFWYVNGQKKSEGAYEHDVPDGRFTLWRSNGQQLVTESYKQGQPDGLWVWWHENGQRAAERLYVDGESSGEMLFWKADGQLCHKADYSLGSDDALAQTEEARPPRDDLSMARRLPPTDATAPKVRQCGYENARSTRDPLPSQYGDYAWPNERSGGP